MILQVFVSVFIAITILELVKAFQKKQIGLLMMLFWLFIWISVLIVVWLPNLTFDLAHILGIERGIDSVVYISIVIMFYLIFKLLVRMEKLENHITALVRKESLKDL